MKKFILLLSIMLVTLSGCIKIKSPYNPINYYRLNHEPLSVQNIDTINASVQMRNLSINDEFNTDHIIATKLPSKEVQFYFYHRWVSQFDDLVTGYLMSRINSYGVFSGGFLPASSINLPDYIMEGRITHVQSNNNEQRKVNDANWTEITLNVSFYKRSPNTAGLQLMFNKNYIQRVNRQNNLVGTIPSAMSKAVALVSDMILVDMHNAISNDINND